MKYWALFAVKAVLAAAVMGLLWIAIWVWYPLYFPVLGNGFPQDLGFTFAIMLHSLATVGVFYLVALDQRYRCRTCARRLRMPVSVGSWTQRLELGLPRTEYICPYGHGTLQVPELHLPGGETTDWRPIDDMWKELAARGRDR
jgi:hypothetical protein